MIGMPNINQYFKVAMSYPVAKLQAIIRGQDHSIPAIAAMAAFEIKGPLEIAAKAQQAAQKQSPISVRDKLAQEGEEEKGGMLPENAMMAMQQQQQGSLPENTGIGQLPAPNMQTMNAANGGIITFDDGGYVPGYAGNEESLVEEETSSPIGRSLSDLFSGPEGAREQYEAQQKKLKKERELAAKEFEATGGGFKQQTKAQRAEAARLAKERGKLSERTAKKEAQFKPYPTDAKPRAVDPTAGQAVTDANASPGFIPPPALSAPPTEKAPARTGIAAVAPQPSKQAATSDMLTEALRASDRLGGGSEAEYKAGLANYGREVESGLAKLATEREQGKPTGQAYTGLEAALKKDEEAVAGKEQRNLQMALINAGLAIAGGTSRYALENIGKGALVGTKQYMDGLDKLEAAAKERQKTSAMIEQERRAEARGDYKEKNEFAARRMEAQLNAKKYSVDGLAKIFGEDKKAATDIFNRLEADKAAMERTKEQGATHLAGQKLMAAAYKDRAGGANLADKAADNARALYDIWSKSPEGKLSFNKPGAADRKYQEILQEQFRLLGIQMPGGGAPAGGAQRAPLSQRTDLFQ